jgi:hypothetical protein
MEPLSLVTRDVQDGQILSPKAEHCRARITHPIGANGSITKSVFCIQPKGHDDTPHLSHPFKNIFSGEMEYLIWRDPAKADFVVRGFDTFTCKSCHLENEFHDVEEPCWSCCTINPRNNYNFDP